MAEINCMQKDGVLYTRLADMIIAYAKENGIKPGERIPSERKLAEIFQTSRASVREAVRILQNKGILEVQIGNGMYLKKQLPEDICRIEIWKIDYLELLEVKTTLEFRIIEELCSYISSADQAAIESALRSLEKSYEIGLFDHNADTLFHMRIRACSTNQTMVQLIDNMLIQLDAYGLGQEEFYKYWYDTVPYHRAMFNAILAHDVQAAKAAFYTIYDIDLSALRLLYGSDIGRTG